MINTHQSIHEILEEDEEKINVIDNKMAELEADAVKKIAKEVRSLAVGVHEKTPKKKFRKRPLNRNESDFLLFKEIFVAPREDNLRELRKNAADIKDKEAKKQELILKHYQDLEMKKFKIFEEEKPDEALEKMRELTKKPDNYEIYNKS